MTDLVGIKRIKNPGIELCLDVLRKDKSLRIKGLSGSSHAVAIAAIFENLGNWNLVVLPDEEKATGLFADLQKLCPEAEIHIYPSVWKHLKSRISLDEGNLILRTGLIEKLSNISDKGGIIVCDSEALAEKIISGKDLQRSTLPLSRNETISMSSIKELLLEDKFTFSEFVYEPGQFSIRGSILDIFSYSTDKPYRIDFFGDTIESIRSFNIETQLSDKEYDSVCIIPNIQDLDRTGGNSCLSELLPEDTLIWMVDPLLCGVHLAALSENQTFTMRDEDDEIVIPFQKIYWDLERLQKFTGKFRKVELGTETESGALETVEFHTLPQPVFNKNFEQLAQNIHSLTERGFTCHLMSESQRQFDRMKEIFSTMPFKVSFNPIQGTLHEGYIDEDCFQAYYTDHQIFERYHNTAVRGKFHKSEQLTLQDFQSLHPGDYVVHIDYGIGIFGGMEKIDNNGHVQETIRLVYRDKDTVYVSLHSLHKISKYRGKEGEPPKIDKLGTPAWQNLKARTKKKIKDIAKDLIELYARRRASEGFSFSPDNALQQELEASFMFEETPDQAKAIQSVKAGMEAPCPMDHLVCGDVGFGKTEVAMRAAFKAVLDNKQVAVLVPTTLLAFQHYQNFTARMKDWPVTIEYLSRMRTPKETKDILRRLESGEIDILIGTHRIVGKDVRFKDLGLLVVDEEQRFGVAVKEKLKAMRVNVDTLTLTATPIPRTLQFSLLGARDLSVISTPPANRYPIQTEVAVFDKELIAEALQRELDRGGQIFYIHQRIGDLPGIQSMLKEICPHAESVIAHGQMNGEELEQIMLDFIDKRYDILISTSIVESGLDIPTVNTIFISKAHMFGLSDLHQLRGRVGRSNRKAYCYLLVPPLRELNSDARRRIRAIEQFSGLGSGFSIAMQDLDIRGAGNLIGAEQSGFIADIGFETYQRILDEAMSELREEEYKDLLGQNTAHEPSGGDRVFVHDCQIDTDLEVLLPEDYVENISERIRLYRSLDNVKTMEDLDRFKASLTDRFGRLPDVAVELVRIVELRLTACRLGIEKISLRGGNMTAWFISNPASDFYKSDLFSKILGYIVSHPKLFSLKETKEKFSFTVTCVPSAESAVSLLKDILR